MGKIRVKTLGDELFEKEQTEKAKTRREAKALKKGKAHIKGVGLKGGQQIKVMEGVELKPEIEQLLKEEAPAPTEEKKAPSKKRMVKVRSKRYQGLTALVDRNKSYNINEAIKLIKKTSTTKFDGTVETHINLNPATLPKDKFSLSGSVILPHGTGKKRRVAIAAEELIDKIANGKIDFDVLVAHPTLMPKLAKVAKILGPKGLMPNPKNKTVTTEPEKRAKELEGGEVNWKTEPNQPLIHQPIGKVSFTEAQIVENLTTLVKSVGTGKIAKLTLNSTMGPGIRVDLTTL